MLHFEFLKLGTGTGLIRYMICQSCCIMVRLLLVISHIVPTDARGFKTHKVYVSSLTLGGLIAGENFLEIHCQLWYLNIGFDILKFIFSKSRLTRGENVLFSLFSRQIPPTGWNS